MNGKELIKHASLFQAAAVLKWRGSLEAALILFLPVLVEDETTKKGATTVLLDFLTKAGLLEYKEEEDLFYAIDGCDSKRLFLVGVGLSLD